jgi:hypothetical protein
MSNTDVRHLLTGQVLHTLAPSRQFVNTVPVPGQPRLLVTGDETDGHVNLWDVDAGECAYGVHILAIFRCARAPIDCTTSV